MEQTAAQATPGSEPNPLEQLRALVGREWHALRKAAQDARTKRTEIWDALSDQNPLDDDLSLVVFGSLGRDEWTSGSDLDWTLLVDGQADPSHFDVAHDIARRLEDAGFKKPGRTGLFGNMAFSHEIIHQIGGPNDTNENTTRRILLLLESQPIGNDAAYERVIRGVLDRYLGEDPGNLHPSHQSLKVPRFLLNDVVRFWRTMAVDFASKQRERAGEGWGLRNIKLRLSRKIVFAAGMIACYGLSLEPPHDAQQAGDIGYLVGRLRHDLRLPPLEVLAAAWLKYDEAQGAATKMFDAYDRFLSVLDDPEKRGTLEKLRVGESRQDQLFQEMRGAGHEFQSALAALFFDNPKIKPLTRKYGLF